MQYHLSQSQLLFRTSSSGGSGSAPHHLQRARGFSNDSGNYNVGGARGASAPSTTRIQIQQLPIARRSEIKDNKALNSQRPSGPSSLISAVPVPVLRDAFLLSKTFRGWRQENSRHDEDRLLRGNAAGRPAESTGIEKNLESPRVAFVLPPAFVVPPRPLGYRGEEGVRLQAEVREVVPRRVQKLAADMEDPSARREHAEVVDQLEDENSRSWVQSKPSFGVSTGIAARRGAVGDLSPNTRMRDETSVPSASSSRRGSKQVQAQGRIDYTDSGDEESRNVQVASGSATQKLTASSTATVAAITQEQPLRGEEGRETAPVVAVKGGGGGGNEGPQQDSGFAEQAAARGESPKVERAGEGGAAVREEVFQRPSSEYDEAIDVEQEENTSPAAEPRRNQGSRQEQKGAPFVLNSSMDDAGSDAEKVKSRPRRGRYGLEKVGQQVQQGRVVTHAVRTSQGGPRQVLEEGREEQRTMLSQDQIVSEQDLREYERSVTAFRSMSKETESVAQADEANFPQLSFRVLPGVSPKKALSPTKILGFGRQGSFVPFAGGSGNAFDRQRSHNLLQLNKEMGRISAAQLQEGIARQLQEPSQLPLQEASSGSRQAVPGAAAAPAPTSVSSIHDELLGSSNMSLLYSSRSAPAAGSAQRRSRSAGATKVRLGPRSHAARGEMLFSRSTIASGGAAPTAGEDSLLRESYRQAAKYMPGFVEEELERLQDDGDGLRFQASYRGGDGGLILDGTQAPSVATRRTSFDRPTYLDHSLPASAAADGPEAPARSSTSHQTAPLQRRLQANAAAQQLRRALQKVLQTRFSHFVRKSFSYALRLREHQAAFDQDLLRQQQTELRVLSNLRKNDNGLYEAAKSQNLKHLFLVTLVKALQARVVLKTLSPCWTRWKVKTLVEKWTEKKEQQVQKWKTVVEREREEVDVYLDEVTCMDVKIDQYLKQDEMRKTFANGLGVLGRVIERWRGGMLSAGFGKLATHNKFHFGAAAGSSSTRTSGRGAPSAGGTNFRALEQQAAKLMKIRLKFCVRKDFRSLGVTSTNSSEASASAAKREGGASVEVCAVENKLTWSDRLRCGCLEMLVYVLDSLLRSRLRWGVNQILRYALAAAASGKMSSRTKAAGVSSPSRTGRRLIDVGGAEVDGEGAAGAVVVEEVMDHSQDLILNSPVITSARDLKRASASRGNGPASAPGQPILMGVVSPKHSPSGGYTFTSAGAAGGAGAGAGGGGPHQYGAKSEILPPPGLIIGSIGFGATASAPSRVSGMMPLPQVQAEGEAQAASSTQQKRRTTIDDGKMKDEVGKVTAEGAEQRIDVGSMTAVKNDGTADRPERRTTGTGHAGDQEEAGSASAIILDGEHQRALVGGVSLSQHSSSSSSRRSYLRQYEVRRKAAFAKLSPPRLHEHAGPERRGPGMRGDAEAVAQRNTSSYRAREDEVADRQPQNIGPPGQDDDFYPATSRSLHDIKRQPRRASVSSSASNEEQDDTGGAKQDETLGENSLIHKNLSRRAGNKIPHKLKEKRAVGRKTSQIVRARRDGALSSTGGPTPGERLGAMFRRGTQREEHLGGAPVLFYTDPRPLSPAPTRVGAFAVSNYLLKRNKQVSASKPEQDVNILSGNGANGSGTSEGSDPSGRDREGEAAAVAVATRKSKHQRSKPEAARGTSRQKRLLLQRARRRQRELVVAADHEEPLSEPHAHMQKFWQRFDAGRVGSGAGAGVEEQEHGLDPGEEDDSAELDDEILARALEADEASVVSSSEDLSFEVRDRLATLNKKRVWSGGGGGSGRWNDEEEEEEKSDSD